LLTMASHIRRESGDGLELVRFFFSVLRGESFTLADSGRRQRPTLDQRLEAAAWLADRGWGRAREVVELIGDSSPAQRLELLRRLSDPEREQLRGLLAKALAPESAPSATEPGAALGPAPEPPAAEHPALPDESPH
jgi:hypothetical protein